MLKTKFMTLSFALVALSAAACSAPASTTSTEAPAIAQSSAQSSATDAMTFSSGTFSGRSDHITTGRVTVEKTNTGYQLNFASDFSLDGAPDPVVALGNNGEYLKVNKLGVLKNKTGSQSYALPASFTPGQFSQVYVWCEKFDVPLGIADLAK